MINYLLLYLVTILANDISTYIDLGFSGSGLLIILLLLSPVLIFQLSICFFTRTIKNSTIKTILRLFPAIINVAEMILGLLLRYENKYLIRILRSVGVEGDGMLGWGVGGEVVFYTSIISMWGILLAVTIYWLCNFIPQRISGIKNLRSEAAKYEKL